MLSFECWVYQDDYNGYFGQLNTMDSSFRHAYHFGSEFIALLRLE